MACAAEVKCREDIALNESILQIFYLW